MNLLTTDIQTERLQQIPITLEYAEVMFKEFTNEITTYMFPKAAEKIEETKAFIESSTKGLEAGTNLQLVVLDKETGEFLGCSGLHNLDKKKKLEFGIWLKKSAHRKGYGKEAILGIKARADKNINYEYILYPVEKNNISSIKIAEAMNGKIEREYDEKNMSGAMQHILEYRIYPKE